MGTYAIKAFCLTLLGTGTVVHIKSRIKFSHHSTTRNDHVSDVTMQHKNKSVQNTSHYILTNN